MEDDPQYSESEPQDEKRYSARFVIVSAFISLILVIFIGWNLTGPDEGWSESEKEIFINACTEGSYSEDRENRLSDMEINAYCECTFNHIEELFNDGPTMQLPDSATSNRISDECMKAARAQI